MVTNRKTEGKNCWFIGSTRKILGKEMDQDDPRHSHDDYMQVAYILVTWIGGRPINQIGAGFMD